MKIKENACHNCKYSKYWNFKFYCCKDKKYVDAHQLCGDYINFKKGER